ncbi:TetR/AcrR family transcriptional regulator [Brunnivagina elsteri]|uniref:TetR family transcriptional regulator n=1 Tax=Brunnivagina elsteri CCALA 953 TaxID=987040 RepID=A0A2A2TC35_9CYAN|nr:TetR/AcrR family transcriptional regulator [Calothrix elsteri]PAX51205.1 TetR family transcriptional regulator [Calothrix elsteri CCALA 953]
MPKIVDHDLYRKELLDKCFDLFAEKGYASVTMRQIAQRLGVSTGTLYHYFPNKQVLFEHLVEDMVQRDILIATADWEKLKTRQERAEALGKYFNSNLSYHIKNSYLMIDFSQHQDSKVYQNREFWQRLCERYKSVIYDFLGVEDPILADFVMCFVDGVILERLLGIDTVDVVKQCTLLGKMVTAYLENINLTNNN